MIAINNEYPEIEGINGINKKCNLSSFCKKNEAYEDLKYILDNIKTKYIFMSYSSDALLEIEIIKGLFQNYGATEIFEKENKKRKIFNQEKEYLICLKIS
jgi:adenine-specific DNA methylase